MREIMPKAGWLPSWVESYAYDRQEVFGKPDDWGYAYAYANRRNETLSLITESVELGATILDIAAA